MKQSLCEMFDVDHMTMFTNFASKPVHTAYTWAISRLKERLDLVWTMDDRHSLENIELRNYLADAIKHYQGDLDEFYRKENSAIREAKVEPRLVDLINTVA